MRVPALPVPQTIASAIRREAVEQQLDNINVLAEALAVALREADSRNEADLRLSLDRYVTAFRWSSDAGLSDVLAYANARSDSHDDLFAPAFILRSTAPDSPETRRWMAILSNDARALLGRTT